MIEPGKPKTKSLPVFIQIFLGIVVFGVIAVYFAVKFISPLKVSDKFINKFNEINKSNQDIKTAMQAESALLTSADQVKSNQDLLKVVNESLAKNDEVFSQATAFQAKISEFRDLARAIKDAEVKKIAENSADILEQRNNFLLKLLADTKDYVNNLKDALNGNKSQTSFESESSILVKKLADDSNNLQKTTEALDAAFNDLAKAAGFEIKKAE